jgi:hypothetical protein
VFSNNNEVEAEYFLKLRGRERFNSRDVGMSYEQEKVNKCIEIRGNSTNRSELHSQRNCDQIKFEKSLSPLHSDSFAFPSAV